MIFQKGFVLTFLTNVNTFPGFQEFLLIVKGDRGIPDKGSFEARKASLASQASAFTQGSYRAIEHSARHLYILHVLEQPNKKHFKAALPVVPTLFYLSNTDKKVRDSRKPGKGHHTIPPARPQPPLRQCYFPFLDNSP